MSSGMCWSTPGWASRCCSPPSAPTATRPWTAACLPVNLAAACSFAPALLEAAAEVCGKQLRDMGVDLALVSMLDVLRDPRWGRSEECFGEDPYLASQMARAAVRGIQGGGGGRGGPALCAPRGRPPAGSTPAPPRIGRRELREIHLPPVKACVEEGVSAFMAAYNEIDGVYCHANPWLLRDLLREEYGFRGFVHVPTASPWTSWTPSPATAPPPGPWPWRPGWIWACGTRALREAGGGRGPRAGVRGADRRGGPPHSHREVPPGGSLSGPMSPRDSPWQQYTPERFPQVKALAEHTPGAAEKRGRPPAPRH